ncbi:WEB family protein chloroplastic-like, partial [Dorcoceras hygrometricum]
RSATIDSGQKNSFSSLFSRTFSASKLCRGGVLGSEIDSNALKSIDTKPSKNSSLTQNWIDPIIAMQQQMGEIEEELKRTKEKSIVSEVENHRVFHELRSAREEAKEANMRANDALSPKKVTELKIELENMKDAVSCLRDELLTKDKKIEYLELELQRARHYEVALAESTESLNRLKERERDMMLLVSENKRRVIELEDELGKENHTGSMMVDSLAKKKKQLDATKIELEEAKTEIIFLRDRNESMAKVSRLSDGKSTCDSSEGDVRDTESQFQESKQSEKKAFLKNKSLMGEIASLKNELKLAIEGEEKSRKAMEDLALALKEVASEANQAKEKLSVARLELEHVKGEAEQFKSIIRSADEKHEKLLDEVKREADLHRNTSDRLRIEAEEMLLAWNAKEIGFVSCIKLAEEEKAIAQHKSSKIYESLKSAENMTRAAREETYKLRDILKQAINESNAAKAAAGIARDENSQLKDCLSEKEELLHFLTQENKRLRINEAAAKENAKEFKRLLSMTSTELKVDELKEQNEIICSSPDSTDQELESRNLKKTFSFTLEDLKFMTEPDELNDSVLDEDPEKAEALKGSIFDLNAETPKSDVHMPKIVSSHQRRHSSAFTEDGGTLDSEDFDNLDGAHDESDTDRSSHRRRKTMFRRMGDLLMIRKSFSRKEPGEIGLTRSARTETPRKVDRNKSDHLAATAAAMVVAGDGGGFGRGGAANFGARVSTCVTLNGSGIQLAVGPQPLWLRNHNFGLVQRIMVKRLATSRHDPLGITDSACKNQLVVVSVQYGPFNPYISIRSTTIGESRVSRDPIAMHTSWRSNSDIASVTRVSMTFRVVRTNQYNQDLGLIHSTNGNHLESPNEGISIDHQVTIYLHAQNITMLPTNETWYFASQILVSSSGDLILILTAQSTRN